MVCWKGEEKNKIIYLYNNNKTKKEKQKIKK